MEQQRSIIATDFKEAFKKITPSAKRGIDIEVPTTRWEDIGGLKDLKLKLREAVEWPIIKAEKFKEFGISTPRGILLYGPPGCSKTTIVRAVASASNASFIALTGASIYSPYLGSAEAIIRDCFKRVSI